MVVNFKGNLLIDPKRKANSLENSHIFVEFHTLVVFSPWLELLQIFLLINII